MGGELLGPLTVNHPWTCGQFGHMKPKYLQKQIISPAHSELAIVHNYLRSVVDKTPLSSSCARNIHNKYKNKNKNKNKNKK